VRWKIAEAKQRLSEVIREAEKEPQIITNRERPVAAVVSAAELETYLELRDKHQRTLSDAIDELMRVAAEEKYTLHLPPRTDRPNPLDPKPARPRRRRRKHARR
jgi:prevent-host-death family protein